MKFSRWLVAILLLAVSAGTSRAETLRFDGERLTVRNLIGEIRVEGARGGGFEVEVRIQGADADPQAIRLERSADSLELVFPEGVTDFVYPAMKGNSKTTLDGDSARGATGAGRIQVQASGRGLELWADVTIRMPAGAWLEVEHGVGLVHAEGLRGEAQLSTRAGNVEVIDTNGEISVATGSGDVKFARIAGGSLDIATGSGDVDGSEFDAETLRVATGSGDVTLAGLRGGSAQVASGSGDVEARGLDLRQAEIGTGSGDVSVTLDGLGDGELNIATGNGDIAAALPRGAGAEIRAETDGGEVRVDLGADVAWRIREKDEVDLTVGSGGARVRLASGSGDIRIGS